MAAPKRAYVTSGGSNTTPHESTNKGLFEFGMTLIGDSDAFGFCPICFNKMDMNGSNNEHILTNAEHKQIFGSDMKQDEYNADWNLMQAHARCNSSKGTRGIFATWLAGRPTGLSDQQYQALCSILAFHQQRARSSIGHFAKGEYKKMLQYIVSIVTGRSPDTIEQFVKL
jgi:hypothetical protein